MKALSKNAIIGYPAGIITGITYGLNPLFALPLIKEGASIESILFFRYIIAVLLLGGFLFLSKQSFKINWKQAGVLCVLGLLYTSSSIFLFDAFKYIGYGSGVPLSGSGGHYYGLSESNSFVAGMAIHISDICRCGHHDKERLHANNQSVRCFTLFGIGVGLCYVYCHN